MSAPAASSNDRHIPTERPRWIYRHSLTIRITHWLNALILGVLMMTGLQIFNAHPALYWGRQSVFEKPWLVIGTEGGVMDDDPVRGVLSVAGRQVPTTGVLGLSYDADGQPHESAFPGWSTIPSYQNLATGRRWHFLFAWLLVINGLVYLVHSLVARHLQRDLVPSREDLRTIPHSLAEHARLRFPRGAAARDYNVLQKLSYLALLVALVVMILAGLTMSPGLNAAFPWLLDLFGGRQSARSIHFLIAFALVAFTLVHVGLVLVAGVVNLMRSMITGYFDVSPGARDAAAR